MKEKYSRKKNKRKELDDALIKKALGYDCTEVTEEYVGGEDGEVILSKKKVVRKNVPPDLTAIKILLEDKSANIEELSDEELIKEKERLIAELIDSDKKEK